MNNNRRNYRKYEKPQWEVEKERIEKERQEEIERGLQPTEENFPVLGSGGSKKITWGGRKFTELASEWKSEDDQRKALEGIQKSSEPQKLDGFVMPTFTPSHHFVEPEELDEEVDISPTNEDDTETEWTTVDHTAKSRARLARKQARIEERLRRLDDGEEMEPDEDNQDDEDDTCWNNQDEFAPIGKEN